MRIKSSDKILGISILKIRDFFKRHTTQWDIGNIMHFFCLDKREAKILMKEFEKENLIEKTEKFNNEQLWRNSTKGNALALASAAKPILRKTADKKINEFLTRVKEINTNLYYLYKIEKVVVFGSYLRDDEKLGDIDLAIKIAPKECDQDKFKQMLRKRSLDAKQDGRHFLNYLEEIFWPREEVLRYLKSRSRSISIHFTDEPILKDAKHKVIYKID